MLPKFSGSPGMDQAFALPQTQTSRTYRLQWEKNRVAGRTEELDAVRQAVEKILRSQRYEYLIYSWNYGVELSDLLGCPIARALPEIQRRITEALTQDDRILRVDAFTFDTKQGKVRAAFTVHTIFGELQGEKEALI